MKAPSSRAKAGALPRDGNFSKLSHQVAHYAASPHLCSETGHLHNTTYLTCIDMQDTEKGRVTFSYLPRLTLKLAPSALSVSTVKY